jgi:hypothetical protein
VEKILLPKKLRKLSGWTVCTTLGVHRPLLTIGLDLILDVMDLQKSQLMRCQLLSNKSFLVSVVISKLEVNSVDVLIVATLVNTLMKNGVALGMGVTVGIPSLCLLLFEEIST